jgi:hypothetical protein
MITRSLRPFFLGCLAAVFAACGGDDDGGDGNEQEVITTVTLTFTPAGGGAAITASFDDPDGDGGAAPTIDPINLPGNTTYTTTVVFLNKLETPPEDITVEVNDESDEHQLFFTGTAVNGPASDQPSAPLTHTYGDTDANGLPIGLTNTMAGALGTGDLTVTLRHLPPVNGVAVKTAAIATEVRDRGFDGLAGETDAQVTFPVTVGTPSP